MKLLEERILAEGIAIDENILKVDGFINHQVEPELMRKIGEDFANHFKDMGVTKVVTIESSGIAPALMTAEAMQVPLLILKKSPSKILNSNMFQTVVTSFTKGTSYELTLAGHLISEQDHVLIIDDFLANGKALEGLIEIVESAGATLEGVGIAIEKGFQPGGKAIRDKGVRVESLAIVESMDPQTGVKFRR